MRFKLKPVHSVPALLAAVALLWVFQAELAKRLIDMRGGNALKVARIEGSLAGGFTLYGLTVKTGEFSAYIPRLELRLDLAALAEKKVRISELNASGAVLTPAPAGAPAAKGPAAALPPWLEIGKAALTDGKVELPGGAVTAISGNFSLSAGRAEVQALRGEYRGAGFTLNGVYAGNRLDASGKAAYYPLGLLLDLSYTLNGGVHALKAAGHLKQVPFDLNARLDSQNNWSFQLGTPVLPLSLARKDLKDIAAPARVVASGKYLTFPEMTAKVRFSADLPRGAAAEGELNIAAGAARLDAELDSPEAHASLRGAYAGGTLDGTWQADSKRPVSIPLEKTLSAGAFSGKGTVGGRPAAPALSWDVSVTSAAYGREGAVLIASQGKYRPAGGGWFEVSAEVRDIFSNKTALGSALLKAEGTPAASKLEASISSKYIGADLAGASEFGGGVLKTSWTSFRLRDAPAWRLCGPFSAVFSKDRYRLSGFCASDGHAAAALSAGVSGGALEDLRFTLSDLSLGNLETLKALPLPPSGVVAARADYVKGARYGTVELSGRDLSLKGLDFGSVSMNGTFTKERFEVLKAEWKVYDGLLSAAGGITLGSPETDMNFVVTASTLNVAPLLVFAPEIKTGNLFLNGAAEIILKGSSLTNRGVIRLESPQVEILPLGLKLLQFSAAARGEESMEASITASAVTKNGGAATARGKLGAAGPDIAIKALKLPFATPLGFSGLGDGALVFSGAWKLPSLSGRLDFPECRFDMGLWRKAPPAAARSRYYESLAMDIKVKSERNAWFRDPPSSVEAKGDLLLKKEHYGPLAIIGTVEAMKGFYTYLGNTFTLESGTLIFGGEVPANPKITVSAANAPKESSIKVYLAATGTFLNPKLAFTSDPAMEQRDIMSYMITGKPLYQSSRNQSDTAQNGTNGSQVAAANLFANLVSQQAAGPLVRKLDIDVLNLRMTEGKAADITVGRYITPQLFVSYGQVLSPGGEKRVEAEYAITPWWSLEGKNSSEGNYVVDLLFKFGIRTVSRPAQPEQIVD